MAGRPARVLAGLIVPLLLVAGCTDGKPPAARSTSTLPAVPTIETPDPVPSPTESCTPNPRRKLVSPWRALKTPSLAPRASGVAAWTGTELVVWGGIGFPCLGHDGLPMADGAAYDPKEERWRKIADSPLIGRTGAASVWTGSRLLVWGGRGGRTSFSPRSDGAAYDPDQDGWRVLPKGPLAARWGHSAVWTGREALIWGGSNDGSTDDIRFKDGARYNPATRKWRALSPAPISARSGHMAIWTGGEMIVWGGVSGSPTDSTFLKDGAAYDPRTDRWRKLAKAPIDGRSNHQLVWTGSEMIVLGGYPGTDRFETRDAAYNPATDRWRLLAKSRLSVRFGHQATWTGTEILVTGGYGGQDNSPLTSDARYDVAKDTWRKLPPSHCLPGGGHSATWTGSELIVFGCGIEAGVSLPIAAAIRP